MPKSFAEVYDLYNSMSSEGALPSDMSLSKFSTFANDVTGTQEFSEGAANSWLPQQLRKGSYWIDKGLEWTGLPQASGKLFSEIFPALGGSAEAGQALGQSLPRGAVDLASFFIPGAGWSQGARMATAGAMSALHAFGDSGSPFDAAVAGVTPYVGGKGGEIATNLLAKTPFVSPIVRSIAELTKGESPTGRIVSQAFLKGGKDKTLAYMASQVGATASMEALGYARDAIANKTLNPYEGRSLNDWVLEATMGNLPYMLGDVRRVVQTPAMAVGKQRVTAETPSAGERSPKVDITGVAEMDGMMRILDAKRAKSLAAVNGIADEALHKQEVDKINALHDYSTKVLKGEAPSNAFGPIWYGEGNQLKVASDALSEQPTPEAPLRQQEAVKVAEQAIQAMPETAPDALTNEEAMVRTMAEADLVQKTSEKMEWDTGELPVYDYPTMEGQPIEEAPPQRLEVDVKRTAETTAEALVEMGALPEEALSSSVAGTKNATVEAVKKEAPQRQINVAKMDAFSELEAAVKAGQADELAVSAYNEVMQAMQKPNANAKKLANAWFNWNHARLNEPREGVDLLGDLKGRLAITLVNEGKAKQLESNVWEADREGNNYAFTSKAEAQPTVNELNAKLPKDAPYEYSSYTNRGTNSPSKTPERPVGIKRKYRDEDTRKKTEFERNKVSPAVVAESKNAAEVITTKPKLPEDSIAKKVAEDSLRTFINKNARKLGMTNKDVQRIDALIASGQDPTKLQGALETMLAQKLTKESLVDEESDTLAGEDSDAPDVINSDEGQGFEGDVTLRAAPRKSSVDSLEVKLLPTTNDALGEILRREGFTEKEVGVFQPFLEGVIAQFNVPDVRMGMIVNDSPNVQLHGLASTRRNMFWLAADAEGVPSMTKVRSHAVVMSHELGHIIEGVVKRGEAPKEVTRQYQNFRRWLETDPAKASEFLDLWRSELPKQYRDLPIWQDLLVQDGVTNLHPDELYANAMAMWSAHKLPAEEAKAWQMIVPQPVRAWSNAITKYARKVISSLNGTRFLRKGEFTQQFHDTVEAVTEMFDVTVKAMRESDKAFAEASRWTASGTQDIYVLPTSQLKWSSTGHGLNMAGEQANAAPKSTANREPNAAQKVWDYAIRTTQALGAEIPVFRRLMNSLHNHAPDMKRMVNATAGPLWGGLSKSTGAPIMNGEQATLARMLDARVNFKLNELVSEAAQWWQQGHEQESFNLETFLKENPEWPPAGTKKRRLGDHYRVMNDMEKKAFNHAFKAMEQSHQLAGKQYVAAHEESGRNDMMLYMSKALPKEQWAQMPDLVRKFTEAMDKATDVDPTTALVGGKSLDALRGIIGNDAVFQGAMDMWMDVKQGSTTLTDYFVKHPGHWSMLRGGNFLVRAYDANGKERADALDSLKDYDEWKRAAKAAGFTRFAEPQAKKPGERFSMGTDVLDLVTQLEQRRAERIQAMPLDEDVKKVILGNMDVSGEVARILAAKDVQIPASMKDLPGGGRRKIPGNMDMMESQKQFFAVTARLNASKVMRSRVAYEMTNPELARFPAEVEAFRRQLDNYMRPDSELSKALMSFNAHYFLAGNIPGMMTNLMQAPFTVMPELINRGVNPFRSTLMMGKAFKDMAKFTERLLTEKIGLGDEGAAIDKMENQDEKQFFGWLNKHGHTNFGALNELTDLNSDAAIDLNRITQSGAPFKPVDKAKSKVKNFARTFMKAYAATEHFNLRLSALLGYRLAKQQMPNATKAELYESALSFMRDTTYAGGRANRPVAQGDLGAIGSMAYSLQSYTLGWLNQMARYIKHWKGADYLDLRPEERTQARNAALTMFGTQVGAAGVLGLPFVGSFLKLLENVTGVDYKGQLYTQLGQILDEDEQEGGGLANSILNGSANAMAANAGVPVDLGSRWSFNSILGFNAYDGFNGDAVFGPTGGVVSSVLAGLKDAGSGNIAGAAKAMSPAALRKALTLVAGEGEVRTREGGLIPLSQGEKFAYALGFNPQKVANLHKYRDLEHSREIAESSQERREAADILDKLQSDPTAANQALQRLADASEGVESKKVIARRVARLAADETFPLDIRESMSRKSGQHLSQIAQMLGVTVPQANVVARTQHMNNILRMLGESPMAVTRAQLAKDRLGEEISPFAGAR